MKILPELSWERKGETHRYTVTEDDWDTLVRAVAHEGQPYDGVMWSLIQRFIWIFPTYSSITDFVQAYAQPINPRWFPDGDLHLKYMKRNHRKAERLRDEEKRAARRVEYASQSIEDLDEKYLEVVNRILSGEGSTTVRGSVHYSASFARRGSNERTAMIAAGQFAKYRNMGPVIPSGAGYRRRVNWFFGAGGSHRVKMNLTFALPEPEAPPEVATETDSEDGECADA